MSLKIKKWLEKLGMEDYHKLFVKFSVSDPMVKCLTEDTLKVMGIQNEVHLQIILSHLNDFCDEDQEVINELRNRKSIEEMEDITKGFGLSNDNEIYDNSDNEEEHSGRRNEEEKPICMFMLNI